MLQWLFVLVFVFVVVLVFASHLNYKRLHNSVDPWEACKGSGNISLATVLVISALQTTPSLFNPSD